MPVTREEVEARIAAGGSLREADLSGVDLSEADLSEADLGFADLSGANLSGANLSGAKLSYAKMVEADLSDADLSNAKLFMADLIGVNMIRADLRKSNLSRASLREANLIKANLSLAILSFASLSEAYLMRADLSGANLIRANLSEADLSGANLSRANLSEADLSGADLRGANLSRAILRGAILDNAYHLDHADLTDVAWDDYTKWPAGFEPHLMRSRAREMRSLGRKAAPLLKLRKPETPRAAREFKRAHPSEFESLKSMTGGRDFTDEVIERVRAEAQTPFEWHVTEQMYNSGAQRLCPDANEVLLLNVNIDDEVNSSEVRRVLGSLREVSKRSGHPYEPKPLFTIGWVRYCPDDEKGVWLVEEVQSDVQGVRKGMSDPDFRRKLEDRGMPPEDVDLALDALRPYAERFYEDALGLVLELAAMKDYSVEMLDYESKRQFGSPRQVYSDLPRSMGMKLSPGSRVLPELASSWKITPNRRRR